MTTTKKKIGLLGILCASLGGIIGSGWLFGSLFAAQLAGPAALVSWLIGGVCMMILALTFAEITTMIPLSGGIAAYPIYTHGKMFGFIFTWITWVTYVVSISQEIQSTVLYMGNKFPILVQKVNGVSTFSHVGYLLSFVILLLLLLLNSFGAKLMANANNIVSLWKILVPSLVVLVFFFTAHNTNNLGLHSAGHAFAPNGILGILSAVALGGVVYSFAGFQHGALLAGDSKNPQRDIPIAIIGSLLFCLVLYMALQYVFITALPASSFANGWKHLNFMGDAGPLAGIATYLGLFWLTTILYVDSIVSPLGTGVLYVSSSSHIVQLMGKTGTAPKFLSKTNRFGTPVAALILNFFVALLSFLPFTGWQAIVSFLSSALVFSFAVGPICLVALRKQQPQLPRPFRLPFYQVWSFFAFYVCNLMIFWSGWSVVWKLGVTVGVGYVVYMVCQLLNSKSSNILLMQELKHASWLIPYLGFMCILSHYSSFSGGNGLLALGPDFLAMAVLSLFIFVLSQKLVISNKN